MNQHDSSPPIREPTPPGGFLVLDTESIPDGKLLQLVKYPGQTMSPEEAVLKAQAEARERSRDGSDFLPVTFQYPVAICVARVNRDFRLNKLTCLDSPHFRSREMVQLFWKGISSSNNARLVTFNGRGFDMPLLELAAFRYGCSAAGYFQRTRHRYNGHLDLMDWLTNYGAYRPAGGLNLLSKMLGKPGKMNVAGDQVYAMFREGKSKEINDYCMHDTLDTYFVFLRTRVLTRELTLEQETELVREARDWLSAKVTELPALEQYLENWGDWQAWP